MQQTYRPGDVANGHRLTDDHQWVPVTEDLMSEPRLSVNNLLGTAIAVGVVALLIGIGIGNAAGDDSTAGSSTDRRPVQNAESVAETRLENREEAVDKRSDELDDRETELDAREAAVAEKETAEATPEPAPTAAEPASSACGVASPELLQLVAAGPTPGKVHREPMRPPVVPVRGATVPYTEGSGQQGMAVAMVFTVPVSDGDDETLVGTWAQTSGGGIFASDAFAEQFSSWPVELSSGPILPPMSPEALAAEECLQGS